MTNASKKSYFELTKKWQRVAALSDAIAMLSWDRQAIMPSGSGAARLRNCDEYVVDKTNENKIINV